MCCSKRPMIRTRSRLLRASTGFPRVSRQRSEGAPGAPFGPGPARALDEALKIAGEWGLITKNHEGYVGTADLCDKEDALHILGHLDVVAPGEGWTVTKPYSPLREGDLLYGRGTDDDKGPVVASLLAMKAVKDLGAPLKANCRMIMGTDDGQAVLHGVGELDTRAHHQRPGYVGETAGGAGRP